VVIQILLAAQGNQSLFRQLFERLKRFESILDAYWVEMFEGCGIDQARIATVRHIAMATFRGLSVRTIYRSGGKRAAAEIVLLKTMICSVLDPR
jgi:hypothetical protein